MQDEEKIIDVGEADYEETEVDLELLFMLWLVLT